MTSFQRWHLVFYTVGYRAYHAGKLEYASYLHYICLQDIKSMNEM